LAGLIIEVIAIALFTGIELAIAAYRLRCTTQASAWITALCTDTIAVVFAFIDASLLIANLIAHTIAIAAARLWADTTASYYRGQPQ
jgi:hypothetical protein